MKLINKFVRDESGATAIEYGLIAALIAVMLIVGAGLVGTNLNAKFNEIGGKLAVSGSSATGTTG